MQPKAPTVKGPAEWFTGDVYFNAYYAGTEPSRTRLNLVRFTPGARTAWHKHAVGQTLHVTEGIGYVQTRGEKVIELHPGDTVYTPPEGMALARCRGQQLHVPPRPHW
jgi:quercetin dioxygenase-like cupin family protein